MKPAPNSLRLPLASLLVVALIGCSQQPAPSKKAESKSPAAKGSAKASKTNEESSWASKSAIPTSTKPEMKAEEKPAATESTEPKKTETAAKPEEKPANKPASEPAAKSEGDSHGNTVNLGDSDLTDGIPGEGPLTPEQVKEWLAKPGVHDTLNPVLPLGMSLGQGQIKGIDKNPLTRAKIELGRQLYFDTRLSADNTISCASCHSPDEGFARSTQFGVGIKGQTGNRNSPVSSNRILSDAQFWDGRAASLEDQAVGPIQNPIEMGNTHEKAVETIKGIEGYRLQFEAVFGAEGVTIGNVGKAIASFERVVVSGPSPADYYEALIPFLKNYSKEDLADLKTDDPDLFTKYDAAKKASEAHPISESAIRGREIFFTEKGNCTACHVGANFSDEKYHNLGVGMDKPEPDLGRFAVSKDEKDKGAFKTPTIRNIAQSGPYMHDGTQKTLEEVVEWYAKGGHPNPHLSDKIKKLELNDQDKKDLVEFMKACTGEFPKIARERLPK